MKKPVFALALCLIFLLTLSPAAAFSKKHVRTEESDPYALEPRVSDGVSISAASEGSMEILAHEDGDMLVFDETKRLSFIAEYGEGWLPCNRYSHFFPNDSRASRTDAGAGVYVYSFNADEGGCVPLSEWDSVSINASAEALPKLYIDAEVPFDEIGKEAWVNANYTLTLGTKEFESGGFEGSGKVKGRGNSSWTYPKKPYSIKLDSKASLLDIPKTKKYAVIPSYYDGSLMRNYVTFKAFQALEGIGYVPKCEFVDVYLNGEYNGIYILCERIGIEKSKIDIEEATAEDLTGGYLIEKDINSKVDFDSDLLFDCPYWANSAKDYFVLKSPEPEDEELTDAMLDYLEDYMQRIHDCIIGENGEDYLDYVDTSSWIDFIIVQEITKNIDGSMKTSCYMYKKSGDDHLYMTAPWDFDLAYGRVSWNNQAPGHNDVDDCPDANTADGFMCVNSSNPWMDKLYDTKPEFSRALKERYTRYRPALIEDLLCMIDEQAAYLYSVQEPNHQLWGMSFTNGVANLKSWLTARIEWLDGEWLIADSGFMKGDVNMDGAVDAADALLGLRASMGMTELSAEAYELADVDSDGEVTAADALLILRYSLGIIPALE